MATLKRRLMVKSYDTLHLETSADVVKLSDGRNVQTAINALTSSSSGGVTVTKVGTDQVSYNTSTFTCPGKLAELKTSTYKLQYDIIIFELKLTNFSCTVASGTSSIGAPMIYTGAGSIPITCIQFNYVNSQYTVSMPGTYVYHTIVYRAYEGIDPDISPSDQSYGFAGYNSRAGRIYSSSFQSIQLSSNRSWSGVLTGTVRYTIYGVNFTLPS